MDAIRYLDRTGCQWDALPADFPHPKLVYHYFKTWTADGTLNRMHNHLREQVRQQVEGRDAQPTAALLDSQSLRGAETVARSSRGYDAGNYLGWVVMPGGPGLGCSAAVWMGDRRHNRGSVRCRLC